MNIRWRKGSSGIVCTAVLALTASAGVLWAVDRFEAVCFEAEAATLSKPHAFVVQPYAGKDKQEASGKSVLAIPPGKQGERVPTGNAVYKIAIPAAGTYYLWARVHWTTGCGNSIFVQFDAYKNRRLVLGGDTTYNTLHWITLSDAGDNQTRPLPLKLKKGTQTLTVSGKETGVQLDQFLLTTDKELRPAGAFPPTEHALAQPKK